LVESRPLPSPPRPELSDRLLAAVAERDGALANRLLQQWVHRRGLSSLEAWIQGPLLLSQGPGASAWLLHGLDDSGGEAMAGIGMAEIEMASIDQAIPVVLDSPDGCSPVDESSGSEEPVSANSTSDNSASETFVSETPVAETPVAETAVDEDLVTDSPAPAPASLAALRAWLPDRSDDLPLAS